MQIGYNDADLQETLEERQTMLPHYLFAFTGRTATQEEMAVVHANMRRLRGLS
jgi:hypothetical protein